MGTIVIPVLEVSLLRLREIRPDLLMTTQMITYGDQDQSPACRGAGARTQVCSKLPVDFGSSEGRGLWDVIHSSVDQEILLSPYLCLSSPYCCFSLCLVPGDPQGVQNTWAVFLKLLCVRITWRVFRTQVAASPLKFLIQ